MIKQTIIILIVFLTFGCTEQSVNQEGVSNEVIDSIEIIDVDDAFYKKTIPIEDKLCDVKIIRLENNENSILADIDQIEYTNEYIYIRDRYKNGSVAIFDKDGKFVKRLSHGNGPNDIGLAQAMFVESNTSNLYVYDGNSYKINKYSCVGEYIESYYFEEIISDFATYNNQFVYTQRSFQNESGLFVLTCKDLSQEKAHNIYLGKEPFTYIQNRYIQKSGNGLNITYPWGNAVFYYDNGKVYKKYMIKITNPDNINFSAYKTAFEMLDNTSEDSYVFNGIFWETKDFQIIEFISYGDYLATVYRNKKTKDSFVRKYIRQSLYSSINCQNVYNYDNSQFVGILFPEFIKNENNPEWSWDGGNPNELLSAEDMEKLKAVKPDDNPLVITYRLKTDDI